MVGCVGSICCFFFFFKHKTAYEMRISDWSSDVCSSDLQPYAFFDKPRLQPVGIAHPRQLYDAERALGTHIGDSRRAPHGLKPLRQQRPDGAGLIQTRFLLEQIEGGIGGGAGQRIAHIGGAGHPRLRSEERRVGKEVGSTWRSEWTANP